MELHKRSIVDVILPVLYKENIIVLTGARQTGKTTVCDQLIPDALSLTATYITFDDPDERLRFQNRATSILESIQTPLAILDEVQKMPSILDPLKYVVDRQARREELKPNKFILTGSSQLTLLSRVKETLAGRAALFHLYPFSLCEAADMPGPSLLSLVWKDKELYDGKMTDTLSQEKIRSAIRVRDEQLQWGGYPPVSQRSLPEDKIRWLKDYRKTYLERDISDVGQVANLGSFMLVQKLLCSRTGQLLSLSEVARDASLAVNTVKRYIDILTLTFQCHLLQPYHENIGKRLIKSPKIYFPDAGLNRVILGDQSISTGAAYESWVFSELLKWKQIQAIEPELYFYRTSAGMEIDFLIAGEDIILPIEAKAAEKITAADGRSLAFFMSTHKKSAPLGIIVYKGREIKKVRENIWAVPDWALFGAV